MPSPIIVIDVDGLRPDMVAGGLDSDRLPHLGRLFGSEADRLWVPVLACAPSITYASQACLATGAHPGQHGVPGSQYFDRFGLNSSHTPRHYAFDTGEILALDDAVLAFTDGLAADCLQEPTIYEQLAARGIDSAVISYMYARGAGEWRRPSLIDLGRLTKAPGPLALSAEAYDGKSLDRVLDYLAEKGLPGLLWVYLLGNDHESHAHGPQAQESYIEQQLDPLIGWLAQGVQAAQHSGDPPPLWVLCSDHGHRAVPGDDRHSLRLGFPFEREIGPLFDDLGLDVLDFPGEDPAMDAVFASNGASAFVYLKQRDQVWNLPPQFERDVLPVAQAFWQEHRSGRRVPDLHGALSAVLLRDVERDGWYGRYRALTPQGEMVSLEEWFEVLPANEYADPVNRLDNLAGPMAGDLLVLSNLSEGYYFGGAMHSVHGGLHPEESRATLLFGWPGGPARWQPAVQTAVLDRCRNENGRQPSTCDLWTGLQAILR